jgi:hypothetical protein
MKITVNPPELLPELLDWLHRHDCVAHELELGDGTCRVIHVAANDPDEAKVELTFFLRAWQTRHPGAAALLTV